MKNRMTMWMCPDINMYYDTAHKNVIAEVELPGVSKKDIKLETGEEGFCLEARRDDLRFDSCYNFSERTEPKKVHAEFRNGLLKLIAPISKASLHARRITVE